MFGKFCFVVFVGIVGLKKLFSCYVLIDLKEVVEVVVLLVVDVMMFIDYVECVVVGVWVFVFNFGDCMFVMCLLGKLIVMCEFML